MKSIFIITFFACIGLAVTVAIPMNIKGPAPDLDDPNCVVCFSAGNFIQGFKNSGDSKEEAKQQRNFICNLFNTDELMQICMSTYEEDVEYIYGVTDLRTVTEMCIDMNKCKAKPNI
ncbi:uncharacterized protein LOC114329043 [Diabrotica virgifera virgifera]|uniref:Uncharacterized protein LOC114329043 n=1 Tax=Diabrotica virgifera virgifera TaxID=50390 RepID=A0A6P7FL86_DIAVI|nr:uncharacterized protein LOC114329043 [Diabrotica virgifera virgifera]